MSGAFAEFNADQVEFSGAPRLGRLMTMFLRSTRCAASDYAHSTVAVVDVSWFK